MISVGRSRGFSIFQTEPLQERARRLFGGSLGKVEMLYKSNLIAVVGGLKAPAFSRNKLIVWDDLNQSIVFEIEFKSEIFALKLMKG